MQARVDPAKLDEIRRCVPLGELALQLGIALSRRGHEFVGLCPFHNESTPSFTVVPAKLFFHCFGCGAHGDAIGLVMRMKGLEFPAAVALLAEGSGVALGPVDEATKRRAEERAQAEAEQASRERTQRTADALAIWRSCRGATGTLVETYLGARGIDLPAIGGMPPSIRFHPRLWRAWGIYGPAMVAAVQGPDGRFVAIHRTFLKDDGSWHLGKGSKRMFGPAWRGAVRLSHARPAMIVAEGIETSLSCAMPIGPSECIGIWAALSLGNIAGAGDRESRGEAHPTKPDKWLPTVVPDMARPGIVLPAETREVTIASDNDNKDPASAECLVLRGAARFRAEGRAALIAPAPTGLDYNALLLREAA